MSEINQTAISAVTRYAAVYGYPVRHSASPAMQNAGIAALGLDWRYLAFEVHPENLSAAISGAKAMKFIGLNLTLPHKLLALNLVESLDESARRWGAVNTIRFEGRTGSGQWTPLANLSLEGDYEVRSHGFNTDAEAMVRALQEDLGIGLRSARVVLLGAGGAGRMAALKLAAEGVAHLHLINRTVAKTQEIAAQIHKLFPAIDVSFEYPERGVDLLLNATSLGLKPEDSMPVDETRFPLDRAQAVYDMIYRPCETPLLRRAKEVGCRVANGLGMLLYQGAKALEIWTGQTAPEKVMRQALERNVYGHAL